MAACLLQNPDRFLIIAEIEKEHFREVNIVIRLRRVDQQTLFVIGRGFGIVGFCFIELFLFQTRLAFLFVYLAE